MMNISAFSLLAVVLGIYVILLAMLCLQKNNVLFHLTEEIWFYSIQFRSIHYFAALLPKQLFCHLFVCNLQQNLTLYKHNC